MDNDVFTFLSKPFKPETDLMGKNKAELPSNVVRHIAIKHVNPVLTTEGNNRCLTDEKGGVIHGLVTSLGHECKLA